MDIYYIVLYGLNARNYDVRENGNRKYIKDFV